MTCRGLRGVLALPLLLSLSCSGHGTETWPAVRDVVATMLVEFEGSADADGRSPVMSGTWETGGPAGDSIPAGLLDLLSRGNGISLSSEDRVLQREGTGVLTVFEPRVLAPDTILIVATWVFPEADGTWHGLEYDFRYRCSRFGCKRHEYFLSGILN